MLIKLHNIETKNNESDDFSLYPAEYNNNEFSPNITLGPLTLDIDSIYSVTVDIEHYEMLLADLRKCNEYVVYNIIRYSSDDVVAIIRVYTHCIEDNKLRVHYRHRFDSSVLMVHVQHDEHGFLTHRSEVNFDELNKMITMAPGLNAFIRLIISVLGDYLIEDTKQILRNLINVFLFGNYWRNGSILVSINFRKRVNVDSILKPIIIFGMKIGLSIEVITMGYRTDLKMRAK